MIHSLQIMVSKLFEYERKVSVGERQCRKPFLPSRAEFVAAWENLVGDFRRPYLVAPARAEVETHYGVLTFEIDQWDDEEALAGRVWAWAASLNIRFEESG